VGGNGTNGNGRHPPEPGEEPRLEQWVPGPGWQRRTGPAPRRRWDRRRLRLVLAGTGGVLVLVAWLLAFTNGVRSVEPSIDDEEFVADAEDICADVRARLADAAAARDDDLSSTERADAVDATVDTLAAMLRDLRDIQPSGEDGEQVAAWLQDWEHVLDSGRRTADALRRDDRDAADDAAREGQDPARAVNAFAGANGLPACGTAPA
jgi:hypothetical protein